MEQTSLSSQISSAFVTGATGLLGNNLVRLLIKRGVRVTALVRSREKAAAQFAGLPVEFVTGDMKDVAAFADKMRGVDVLFHTAAYFRESYKGGRHRDELMDINVRGTREILSHADSAGIRRFVHVSSSNVLDGEENALIDETMDREIRDADDYAMSKMLSGREIKRFLDNNPDVDGCQVLPGWIVGPGDVGPTSSGQLILDFINRKLPGIPPATFSIVDARDVAESIWKAALYGCRGERYLVAGRHITMSDLFAVLEKISGVPAPRGEVPFAVLYALATMNEAWRLISRKPALISLAGVQFMKRMRNRTHFSSEKSRRELGIEFRPLEESLRDTILWYRQNGWLQKADINESRLRAAERSL